MAFRLIYIQYYFFMWSGERKTDELWLHTPVYGLRVEAAQPLPGLLLDHATAGADVRLWLDSMPAWFNDDLCASDLWYSRSRHGMTDDPVLRVWKLQGGDYFRLLYYDGTSFIINRTGTEIWATWPKTLTLEDTATYLLGPVFGFLLRLRGVICLHASTIVVGNKVIALVGQAMAGKSTTAAAFAQQGYAILTEDVAALSDQGDSFLVQPGYPLIRLWPSSVQTLYGNENALPRLTPNWDKRYLKLTENGYKFQQEPLQLAAVYFLDERLDNPEAPLIETVPAQSGMMKLIANTYTNYLLDQQMRAWEFDLLGRLLKNIPLRNVIPHADPARLPDLCQAILADFHKLNLSMPD